MCASTKKYELIDSLLQLYTKYFKTPLFAVSLAVTINKFKELNLEGVGMINCVGAIANETFNA